MKKKYKSQRIPLDAWKKFTYKKERMEEMAKRITGKQTNIPMTRFFRIVAAEPIFLNDVELIKKIKKKKK